MVAGVVAGAGAETPCAGELSVCGAGAVEPSAGEAAGCAGEAAGAGVAAGLAEMFFISELSPPTPKPSSSATSIKVMAAPMVILARMVCVPRGPKAVLETELVKSCPASALPGCKSTEMTSAKQASMNNP